MARFKHPDGAQRASTVKEREIEWLLDNRIPRSMITLVAGRAGQGKSLFSAWLAARVSQRDGHVIFSNDEDLVAETSRPRLRLAGADLNRIHFWKPDVTTPDGLAMLEAFVRAVKVKLLILDPVASHFPNGKKDDRAVVEPLVKLCERTGLAVVAIDHTRKSVGRNTHPQEAVLGNGSGFQAAARFVYVWGANPNDPDERVLAGVKTNVAEVGSMSFVFDVVDVEIDGEAAQRPRLLVADEDCKVTAHDVVQFRGDGDTAGGSVVKRAVAAEWLTSFLMFGKRPTKEVEKAAADSGLSWATMRRAATELEVVKTREGYGKDGKWLWELPAGHPALLVGQAAKDAAGGVDLGEGELTVEKLLELIDAGGEDDE